MLLSYQLRKQSIQYFQKRQTNLKENMLEKCYLTNLNPDHILYTLLLNNVGLNTYPCIPPCLPCIFFYLQITCITSSTNTQKVVYLLNMGLFAIDAKRNNNIRNAKISHTLEKNDSMIDPLNDCILSLHCVCKIHSLQCTNSLYNFK